MTSDPKKEGSVTRKRLLEYILSGVSYWEDRDVITNTTNDCKEMRRFVII